MLKFRSELVLQRIVATANDATVFIILQIAQFVLYSHPSRLVQRGITFLFVFRLVSACASESILSFGQRQSNLQRVLRSHCIFPHSLRSDFGH